MPEENEFYKVAVNVDRGDGSKLADLLAERDTLLTIMAAKDLHINKLLAERDAMLEAARPFIMAKPIPATLPPESILFRFGCWHVYLKDLLKLRVAYWKIETP